MALIKEALEKADRSFKDFLYPDKDSKFSKKVKPFSFSVYIPRGYRCKTERFVIDEDVEVEDTVFYLPEGSLLTLFISSSDYQFMINLYNGLLKTRRFKFNDEIILFMERVYMLNEKPIPMNQNEVTFKTLSPVLVEDKEGKPLLPFSEPQGVDLKTFNTHFNAIHDRILKDLRGKGLYRELEFIPFKLRKQVVKHTLRGFRSNTGKPYMILTPFHGTFCLRGDPGDLQMLYQIGIGLRTGQGFGMVEVIK
jgi:CRISPR-associated endoribonuclease Cas6